MYDLYTLKNGLRIVTEKIEHVNSISIGVIVKNGSRNEHLSVNGISHFIEHMMFKGTKKRTAKDIVEEIENVGGQINAYTSKESTCYYVKALNTHLDLSLDILSDMILNSSFHEEEIRKEHGVVLEEINMTEDNPEDVLGDVQAVATFGNDPIAYPILGTSDSVRSFNSEKIKNYIKNKYTPKNTVISICGSFDHKELKKQIEHYFGGWECESSESFEHSIPEIKKDFLFYEKNIEQLHINLGLKGVEQGSSKGYSLLLLNNILGGGASSVLFQKIREELGLCYSIYSYLLPYEKVGTFNIYVGLSPNHAEKAIDIINNEIDIFRNRDFTETEIGINKEKIKANYILGLESTSSRMFSNGRSVLRKNRIVTPADLIKKIDKIDIDSIKEVQGMCFNEGIVNGAFVGRNISIETLSGLCKNNVKIFDNNIFS